MDDAARLITARGRAFRALEGRGTLASVAVSAERARSLVSRWGGRISIAAVNAAESVVVSGETPAVEELLAECVAAGTSVRTVGTIPYHSAQVAEIRDDLLAASAGVSPRQGTIPFVSTVTGGPIDGSLLDAEYWYRNARDTVRFADAVRHLVDDGYGTFVELSPHPVLSANLTDVLEQAGRDGVVTGTLRRGDGGPDRFVRSLAELYQAGVPVDWPAVVGKPGPEPIDLPTYAFQRDRYWLAAAGAPASASALGLAEQDHPLLGAGVELPDAQGWLFTTRLSVASHPWLADHQVDGSVLLPGTALLELVRHAGDRAGTPVIDELTLLAPVVVPSDGGVALRTVVTAEGSVTVHMRHSEDDAWTRCATGVLTAAENTAFTGIGPVDDAASIPVEDLYDRFADAGQDYGPAFRGLRRAWRRDGDLLVQVELAEQHKAEAGRFGVHPALLDSVLHGLALAEGWLPGDGAHLPFELRGVRLAAAGASALTARLRRTGDGTVTLLATDPAGRPVLSVDAVTMRPAPAGHGFADSMFVVGWSAVPARPVEGWVVTADLGDHSLTGGGRHDSLAALATAGDVPEFVVLPVPEDDGGRVLGSLQEWLAEPEFAGSTLVVLTSGAAGVQGLVRSAIAEHPGRFGLLDVDTWTDAAVSLGLSPGEPECVVADGAVLVPRLVRHVPAGSPASPWGDGSVLITGGLGGIGTEVARRLADDGVPNLILIGRRGMATPGAAELVRDLERSGATVTVHACDVADRDALAGVLDRIPGDRPLTGVVHAAGTLADATITSMTPDQLRTVWRPKVDGARNLDELTRHRNVSAFVVFSSVAATFGGAGQGGYAAANAELEALVRSRRAAGLPGVAIAWGLWEATSGMAATLRQVQRDRFTRLGIDPLPAAQALALLDAAVLDTAPVVVAARLNLATLRDQGAAGRLAPLFGELVPARARRGAATGESGATVLDRLRGRSAAERMGILAGLVREHVGTVLGYADPIPEDRVFRDLGFDSLTSVELRNRLAQVTGLRLPATLVFDYPTVSALAGNLAALLDEDLSDAADQHVPVATIDDSPTEPIAIVSMACRFPGGVRSPEDLWTLLTDGGDAIGEFPRNRDWDLDRLPGPVRSGGFLYEAAGFDAGFFGVSAGEALAMDPQQRLLLEVVWESLERARIVPESLRGSATGVFVGVMYHDYAQGIGDLPVGVDGYLATGTSGSVVSGRVAYLLGLEGPAVSVDTACSSSLVSIHLACQSLRSGESSLAVAGGVTVMASPNAFVEFGRLGGMSPDGRCKPFSAAADGVGWSEGVGVVVLERLSDARRRGHPVLAVVRGSAVNQDGASNGLTAPNGPAQQRVIRQALARAGVSGAEVDAVEAHGTGTPLGDPIEAQALLATYGQQHDQRPLWLGSVKSNLGHTQAAAGVAGVIKMVQAMRHGVLPRTLHVTQPSSEVDWDSGGVSLLTDPVAWPEADRPRRAGVSSFGISGTNAHVILEQPPPTDTAAPAESPAPAEPLPVVPWVLSARSRAGLRERARQPLGTGHSVMDVGWSLATTRSAFEHRAVVLGADSGQLTAGLSALAEGRADPRVIHPEEPGVAGPVAFVFPGQGGQRIGMGRALSSAFPVFGRALDEVIEELDGHLDGSLREVLWGTDEDLLTRAGWAQPAVFAIEVALYRLLESWQIRPDHVIGHSFGELAAAQVAGVLSLPDAARLVAARARLMHALPEGGAMAAVTAPRDQVAAVLTEYADRVGIAAVNAPDSVVISGDRAALVELADQAPERGWTMTILRISFASHSPLTESIVPGILAVARELTYHEPVIPVISTLTGRPMDSEMADPGYWGRQIREPVLFADALAALRSAGTTHILELGPGAALTTLIAATEPARVSPLLPKGSDEPTAVLTAVAELFAHGNAIDWRPVFAGHRVRTVDLPTYPFQHQDFWLAPERDEPVRKAGTDQEFWQAVQRADVPFLADMLDTDPAAIAEAVPALADWRRHRTNESIVDEWCHRSVLRPLAGRRSRIGGRWLFLVPHGYTDDEAVTSCLAELETRGAHVDSAVIAAHAARRADLRATLAATIGDGELAGAVSLLGLDERSDQAGVPLGLIATVGLVQALGDVGVTAPLWCVTRGAVDADDGAGVTAPAQAALWGFGRVAALEHPDRWGGLIDLPARPGPGIARSFTEALTAPEGETELVVRSSGVLTRRVVREVPVPTGSRPLGLDGTVLITGGTGAIGRHVARALAAAGARRLLLVSRSGDGAGVADLATELGAAGVLVDVAACDVADRTALAGLIDGIPETHPLTAVIHAAGVLDDAPVHMMTPEQLRTVLRPKLVAARNLHELTMNRNLSAFVLFSSMAGFVGNGGQGAYAAGNAYLDGLAAHRRHQGLPAVTISWGWWEGDGLAAGNTDAAAQFHRSGITAMDPGLATTAVLRMLRGGEGSVMVGDVDWKRFRSTRMSVSASRLFDELGEDGRAGSDGTTRDEEEASPQDRYRRLRGPDREHAVLELVRGTAAIVLGRTDDVVLDQSRSFRELGFGSLTAIEFRNRLGRATGLALPASLVFDFPTIAAVVGHITSCFGTESESADDIVVRLDELRQRMSELPDGRLPAPELAVVLRSMLAVVDQAAAVPQRDGTELVPVTDDGMFQFITDEFGIS